MDIPLHAQVVCTDGPGGKTSAVVLKPASEEVTHVVIRETRLLAESVIVPIDYISESTPEQVHLRLARNELAAMPPFAETDLITPPPGYSFATAELGYPMGGALWPASLAIDDLPILPRTLPKGEVTLHQGDGVEATDGHVGRVDELLIDPQTNDITHLVMREGHLWDTREVTISVTDIDRIEDRIVYLRLTKQQIEALPERPVQ